MARPAWIVAAGVLATLSGDAWAQNRGVYPLGMSALNSGITSEPGFTYSNLFLLNSRDELRGPDGAIVNTGQNAVMIVSFAVLMPLAGAIAKRA